MVSWTRIPDDEAARTWDRDLERFPERSFMQGFGWGQYKAGQGWSPVRAAARDGHGSVVGMVQALVRRYVGGFAIVWCPGGHAGPIELWNAGLVAALAQSVAARHVYCRVTFTRPVTDADADRLRSLGWTKPSRSVSAPRTLVWDLTPTEEAMMAALSGNWRHNLHRALRRNLRVVQWTDPPASAVAPLFDAMAAYKQLDMPFDPAAFGALAGNMSGRTLIYACENDAGTPVAVRGCVIDGKTASDLIAATSPEGRRCYASYAVLWALIRGCRARDVDAYDLGGADPVAAPGVYAFKRGTGAREQHQLGEWEWSTSRLLARVVNLRIRLSRRAALA